MELGIFPSIPFPSSTTINKTTRYYFNPSTQASTWQNPLNNAPHPSSPPPYAGSSSSNDNLYDNEDNTSSTDRGLSPLLAAPLLGRVFNSMSHHHSPSSTPPPINHSSRPSGPSRLYIHAATFSELDVTTKLREMITPEQTLSIHCDSLTFHFGDPWPNHKKQFSVLYSYGTGPWQVVATAEGEGSVVLNPVYPVDYSRAGFVQDPRNGGKVIAIVWGMKNALSEEGGGKGRSRGMKIMEVEREGRLAADNEWVGFDGWENEVKMAVVYFRRGDGSVGVVGAREGETLRLPWNGFGGGS